MLDGKPYLVGPLARVNLNKALLPEEVKQVMQGLKAQFPSKNMFHSIIARALEIYFAILEAERLLADYATTEQPCMAFEPTAGAGYGCTEAPRGILWHRYDMDGKGCVKKSIIVPPTSQSQPRIEQDLKDSLINFGLDKTKEQLQLHAEKVIRNYNPCISCATHFLDLKLIRDGVAEKNKQKETTVTFNNVDLSRTAIIGIGSPHKGDEPGWQMIDQLLQNKTITALKQKGLSLFKLDRPGIALVENIKPYDHVLIVDAIKSNNDAEQSFICVDASQFISKSSQVSSHEAGVFESIALLESLQLTPEQLVVFGISRIKDEFIEKIINMF
jgi:hydrogenase maturation protease